MLNINTDEVVEIAMQEELYETVLFEIYRVSNWRELRTEFGMDGSGYDTNHFYERISKDLNIKLARGIQGFDNQEIISVINWLDKKYRALNVNN